jgi:hypothetical protein
VTLLESLVVTFLARTIEGRTDTGDRNGLGFAQVWR